MRVKTATITTNCEISGPPHAPVVMLSHSLGSNLLMWGPQLAVLEGHFRVLRYDTRGHGGSDIPGDAYRLEELVADAAALLDALAIPTVHFVGLSMGGMIAQGFALSHPDRLDRLVLCDTSAFMPAEAQPIIQDRIDTARREGLAALVDSTLMRWFTTDYLRRRGPGVDMIQSILQSSPAAGYIGCTEAIRRLNYLDDLSRIERPTLIVVGEDDPGTPVAAARAIHERISGSRLVILPSASHLCNIEQPQAFNSTLTGFLGSGA